MASGDVYKVQTSYVIDGQTCLNDFWYVCVSSGVGIGAQQLVNWFNSNWWAALDDILGSDLTSLATQTFGVCMADVTDSGTATLGIAGAGSDEHAPSMWTAVYRSVRAGINTRYAFKSFSGITRDLFVGNNLNSAYSAATGNVIAALGATPSGGGWTFNPILAGTPRVYGTNPPIRYTITGWSGAQPGVRESRRQGVGI